MNVCKQHTRSSLTIFTAAVQGGRGAVVTMLPATSWHIRAVVQPMNHSLKYSKPADLQEKKSPTVRVDQVSSVTNERKKLAAVRTVGHLLVVSICQIRYQLAQEY